MPSDTSRMALSLSWINQSLCGKEATVISCQSPNRSDRRDASKSMSCSHVLSPIMSPCSNHFTIFQFITQDAKDQNRESQRRSRARRTEVMNDLKNQVEAYQRQGTAASLEMQRVAQAVAFENGRLRNLLKLQGVSQDDIERYIAMPAPPSFTQASLYEPSSLRCRSCGSTSIVAEKLPVSLPAGQSCAGSNSSQEDTIHPQPSTSVRFQAIKNPCTDKKTAIEAAPTAVVLPPQSIIPHESGDKRNLKVPNYGHQSQNLTSYTGGDKDKNCDGETSLDVEAPFSMPRDPPYVSIRKDHTDAMETSCDTAASILVDLHHHTDTQRVRAALGCKGPNSCTVNNIKIFQLLENFS